MVGFRDLVGTGIAPVSKKTAVKRWTLQLDLGNTTGGLEIVVSVHITVHNFGAL